MSYNGRQRCPRVEGCGLAAEVSVGIDQVPDNRLLDPEPPPRGVVPARPGKCRGGKDRSPAGGRMSRAAVARARSGRGWSIRSRSNGCYALRRRPEKTPTPPHQPARNRRQCPDHTLSSPSACRVSASGTPAAVLRPAAAGSPRGREPMASWSSSIPMITATQCRRRIDFSALDRYPQPLTGVGHEASKPRERPTGPRSAPTREKRHRRGMRGVLANRLRTAETTDRAAQGQSVSRRTVAEVPLAGLSFFL